MLKRSIFLLLVAVSAPSHVLAECGPSETAHHYFDCGPDGVASPLDPIARLFDLSCVPIEWRCDGTSDCMNGADEQGCGEFQEFRNRALSAGYANAALLTSSDEHSPQREDDEEEYESDEEGYGDDEKKHEDNEEECGDDRYQCRNGPCITKYAVCDGVDDCPHGDDEWLSSCFSVDRGAYVMSTPSPNAPEPEHQKAVQPAECPSTQATCGDGICIPLSWRCDGEFDCPNNSDEQDCGEFQELKIQALSAVHPNTVFSSMECPLAQVSCEDGTCIPLSWRCDGTFDCNNHSDEQDCAGVGLDNSIENSASAEDDLSNAATSL